MKPIQTELFPNMQKPAHKKLEHTPLEKGFMQDIMGYARRLDLACIHLQTYHENSFWVTCPCCGQRTLATCRKPVNTEYAGWPDILFVSAGIECKRQGMQPNELQIKTHERLRKQGVPVMVASPDNVKETEEFIYKMAKVLPNGL
jgi:hypothetical protein